MTCGCLPGTKNTAQIEGDGVQKHLRVGVGKVQILTGIRGAEVVDQYIDATGITDHILHRRRKTVGIGSVAEHRIRGESFLIQLTNHIGGPGKVPGCQIDLCALFGTSFHTGQTDAPGGGGDQYDFLLQSHKQAPF